MKRELQSPWVLFLCGFFIIFFAFSVKFAPKTYFVDWGYADGLIVDVRENDLNVSSPDVRMSTTYFNCWVVYAKYKVGSIEYMTSAAYEGMRPYLCVNSAEELRHASVPLVGERLAVWFDKKNPEQAFFNNVPYRPRFIAFLVFGLFTILLFIFMTRSLFVRGK